MKLSEFNEKISLIYLSDVNTENFNKIINDIDLLIDKDTINSKLYKGSTILGYMIRYCDGSLAIDKVLILLDLLFKKGADPNIYEKDDFPIIVSAIRFNQIEVVKKLIDNGADINLQFGINKLTPLMELIVFMPTYREEESPNNHISRRDTREKFAFTDLFLSSNKLNTNIQNINGHDTFMYALDNNTIFEASCVLQSVYQYEYDIEYNFNKQDTDMRTPLFYAVEQYNK